MWLDLYEWVIFDISQYVRNIISFLNCAFVGLLSNTVSLRVGILRVGILRVGILWAGILRVGILTTVLWRFSLHTIVSINLFYNLY